MNAQGCYDKRIETLRAQAERLNTAIAELRGRDINGNWGHCGDLNSVIEQVTDAVEAAEAAAYSAGFLSRKGN
jgi:hypothetical protein